MRIVAGRFRGQPLAGPTDAMGTRPTSDRLREMIFNMLDARFGDPVAGAHALDLFAGTGALGLEALSRGAAHATFVEAARGASAVIARNVAALGVRGETTLMNRSALRLPLRVGERPARALPPLPTSSEMAAAPSSGAVASDAPCTLVFADPPYGKGLGERALAHALAQGWIAPGALCVLEETVRADILPPPGFEQCARRAVGAAQVLFLFCHGERERNDVGSRTRSTMR